MKRLVPGLVIGALVLSSSSVAAQGGDTLSAVQDRGQVICGVNGGLPGMSVLNEDTGVFEGKDADYCRAIAAAVLGDPVQRQRAAEAHLFALQRHHGLTRVHRSKDTWFREL